MSQVVLNVSRAGFAGIAHVVEGSYSSSRIAAPTREVIILALVLTALQVCDGILTAIGINAFGISAEGNGLLRYLMELIGFVPALIVAKSAAIMIIGVLCSLSARVAWIRHAMKVVIGVYLIAAVVPWSMILLDNAF